MDAGRPIDIPCGTGGYDNEEPSVLSPRDMAAYNLLIRYVGGKKVLEAGFGDGCGTDFLSSYTTEITGMEASQDLVDHARSKYVKKGLWFIRGDATDIPFSDGKFDALVSLRALECVKDHRKFLTEARRIIKDDGLAVFVTSNRKTMLDGLDPDHFKEFGPKELERALTKVFGRVEITGLFGSDRYLKLKSREHGGLRMLLAIDFLRLRRLLPKAFLKPFHKRVFEDPVKNAEAEDAERAADIGMDDFHTDRSRLDKALDLIAVCRK